MPILYNPRILCNFVVFHYMENTNCSIDDVKLLFQNVMIIKQFLPLYYSKNRQRK